MNRPEYWKHLAEEHGKCAVDFIRAGIEPYLIYEQTVIAGYFGRLHLASQESKELEAPEPGTCCETCGENVEVVGFCGVCEERNNPRTLAGFLRYAAESTVNSR